MSYQLIHIFNSSTDLQLKPLKDNSKILHVNVEIRDIWTLKVFFNTECPAGKAPYEVQIFRSHTGARDTPFSERTFLKDISQVFDFIENFQEWTFFQNLSFDDLKFVDHIAVITKNHPEFSNVTCNFKVTMRPDEYYDCSYYEVNTEKNTVYPYPCSQLKFRYCTKNDITHYMRWFAEWLENYHELEKGDLNDSYLFWVSEWPRM
jgi:hypothetical protein